MTDNYTVGIVILVALAGIGSAGVPAAVADDSPPPLPAAFYGDLEINGEPVPEGAEVVAKIDGEERGSIVVDEAGTYGGPGATDEKLVVDGTSGDDGAEITFYVDGLELDQTATWESGSTTELNLSASVDPPEIADFDAPTDVSAGESFAVTATVENTGDRQAIGTVEYRLATAGTPLDANATIDDRTVDLDVGESETVTFDVDAVPTGEYDHGVATSDGDLTASLSVGGEDEGGPESVLLGDVTDDGALTFADGAEVHRHALGLEPSEPFLEDRADANRDGAVDTDDVIAVYQRTTGLLDGPHLEVVDFEAENGSVEATVENAGDYGAVGTVEYRLATAGSPLDANATVAERDVDLGPGENATVTFETGSLPAGEYDHGVATAHDERTARLGADADGSVSATADRIAHTASTVDVLVAN